MGGRRATIGGGRRGGVAAMGGRQGGSRRARSNVTYNEDELSEMSRPVYLDWRGEAGQDPTESGNDYRDRQSRKSDAAAAAPPAKKKSRRR